MIKPSLTERAVDFIRKRGVARSYEIEAELGINYVSALLADRVRNGQLVACKVDRPGQRACNEFRISVNGGGKAPEVPPLRDRSKATPPQRPDLERKNAAALGRPARKPASGSAPSPAAAAPRKINGSPVLGKIEDGVPVPLSPTCQASPLRAHLQAMRPGQSFFTTYAKNSIQVIARKLKIRIRQAQEGDGRRVWRIA